LIGFHNIIEQCRRSKIEKLIYASSSSIYGLNEKIPFSVNDKTDYPVSLYGATKKSNELVAHAYSHLYGLKTIGLRFFTVYGPWGRPDMAPMIFAKAIMKGDPIEVYNFGDMKRDFTYIDDVVEVICRCCYQPATIDKSFNYANPLPSKSFSSHRIFNVGNENSIGLLNFISSLEKVLGKKVEKIFKPVQDGDVLETAANTDLLEKWIDFKPKTNLEDGLNKFALWYLDYFRERY
jgi:UDP-glucuronate 4-epimerase